MTGLAKKSLFSILAARLDGAIVLDLYCGTGTLGLEALSCGARRCAFAESNRLVLRRLKSNIELCGVQSETVVWPGYVERRLTERLEQLDEPVDIAFVDPPFSAVRKWNWPGIVEKNFQPLAQHLADNGVVLLRTPGDVDAPAELGELGRTRLNSYGDMRIGFYEHA